MVLVLSDGKDSGPIGFRQPFVSQAEVIDRARSEDVMVYGIGMRSRGADAAHWAGGLPGGADGRSAGPRASRWWPRRPAAATSRLVGQDLGEAFARVVDEFHSQYLIGFAPPKRDGKVHEIEVRIVSQRGLKPRARKNYVAPKGKPECGVPVAVGARRVDDDKGERSAIG